MRTLAAMCNSKLNPVPSGPAAVSLPGPLEYGKGVCALAESRIITALEDPKGVVSSQPLAELFTVDGTISSPLVAVRKATHEQTMLTFVDTNIDGIVCPAGSLLNARAVGEPKETHIRNKVEMPVGYSVRPIGDVACAAFMRLTAFALPPLQQHEYGVAAATQGRSLATLQSEVMASAVIAMFLPARTT
jgi:hypothetical protein